MLLEFAKERNEHYYSEHLGIDFIENHFKILEKDFDCTLKRSEFQNLRVIRMLGDFQLHRTILRRYYKHKKYFTINTLLVFGFSSLRTTFCS